MNLQADFEPTPTEITSAIGRAYRARRIANLVVAVLVLAVGIVNLLLDQAGLAVFMLLLGIFAAWVGTGGIKSLATNSAVRLCRPLSIAFTSEVFAHTVAGTQGSSRWDFVRVVDTGEAWLFLVNRKIATVLPKRALDAAQTTEFATFLAQRNPRLNGTRV